MSSLSGFQITYVIANCYSITITPYYICNRKLLFNYNNTLLYVAGNSIEIMESHLSDDLNLLAEQVKENKLILNKKKGKTEEMTFGTVKRLPMLNIGLIVKCQHYTVNLTTSYRYLGVDIDPSITFNNYFMTTYKKFTGHLHLLSKLWSLAG